jgi:hypothetical protein
MDEVELRRLRQGGVIGDKMFLYFIKQVSLLRCHSNGSIPPRSTVNH